MKLRQIVLYILIGCLLLFTACNTTEPAAPAAEEEAPAVVEEEEVEEAVEEEIIEEEASSDDEMAEEEMAEDDQVTIAFSPLALSIPALKGLSEGVEAVGSGVFGYDVIILDPDFDAPKQAQQLNELIATGRIDAAWVIAVNPGAMKEVVDTAQANGVVLVMNGVPEDYGYDGMQAGVTFARINYEKFGGAVGQMAGQCINERLGGEAQVIVLQSAEGTAGKQEIEEAMEAELLAAAPNAEIVATAIVSERAEGQTTVSQLLLANPGANVVMATNDEGGLGALGAFEAAGKEIPCLVDAGGNEEVLEAVDNGEMYGASVLQFEADMMQTFDAFVSMMADPTADGAQLEVPVLAYTQTGGMEEEAMADEEMAEEAAMPADVSEATMAFSPLALSIPALKGLSEGVQHVGADILGYEEVIILDPDFDAPKQAQQLNELIATGRIDAAWVIAVNPGAMKDVVDTAQENGVVLVMNGVPEDYGYDGMQAGVTFARINYERFGGTVGQLAGECINERLGGEAQVIVLQSAEGTAGKQEIEEAMEAELLAAAPNAEIVATAIVSERAEGQTTVSQLLLANPGANVVMATNDEGGLGALGAFEAAGKEIPCLVDAGGNEEVLEAVANGEMYGAAVLQFEADMMQTFDALATMMADPSAAGAQLEVPVEAVKTE